MKKIISILGFVLVTSMIYATQIEYITDYSTVTWNATKVFHGNWKLTVSTLQTTSNFEIVGGTITKCAGIDNVTITNSTITTLSNTTLYGQNYYTHNASVCFTDSSARLAIGAWGAAAGINILSGSLYIADILRFTSGGIVRATAGTTATPALSFASDTDTGFSNIDTNKCIQVILDDIVFGTFTGTNFTIADGKEVDGYDISEQFLTLGLSTATLANSATDYYNYFLAQSSATDTYLFKTEQAADSDLLDNHDSLYFSTQGYITEIAEGYLKSSSATASYLFRNEKAVSVSTITTTDNVVSGYFSNVTGTMQFSRNLKINGNLTTSGDVFVNGALKLLPDGIRPYGTTYSSIAVTDVIEQGGEKWFEFGNLFNYSYKDFTMVGNTILSCSTITVSGTVDGYDVSSEFAALKLSTGTLDTNKLDKSSATTTYVFKTGDTITGNLIISTATIQEILVLTPIDYTPVDASVGTIYMDTTSYDINICTNVTGTNRYWRKVSYVP